VLVASVSVAEPYIAPWTSPKLQKKTVSCWGRKYEYGNNCFPSKIITQGKNILADEVELQARVGGKEVVWKNAEFKTISINSITLFILKRAI
jgi:hypothetical protein